MDINEYSDRFEAFIDLPGVDPKSVEITLDHDVLTLSSERSILRRGAENHQAIRRRSERIHGRCYRRCILPETVDTDRVTAKGGDGALELTVAKQAKAQPRRIQIAA